MSSNESLSQEDFVSACRTERSSKLLMDLGYKDEKRVMIVITYKSVAPQSTVHVHSTLNIAVSVEQPLGSIADQLHVPVNREISKQRIK